MARLDVRLDDEQRRRLDELVEARGAPISDVARGLIDDAYEDVMRERRRKAVERMVAMEIDVPLDPDELSRELERAHEPGVLIDANVPVCAAGRPHSNKEPCARIMEMIVEQPVAFFTDVEVLQELVHLYNASGRWALGREVLRDFIEVMHDRIEPVYVEDMNVAAILADEHPGVSARDLVHAAVMRRVGADIIISADSDFDRIPNINRLYPAEMGEWSSLVLAD